MKKIWILLLVFVFIISGCSKEEKCEVNPIATLEIENYGSVTIELYSDVAYNTVANFVNLIEDGFYDNNTIHRVQKGFVIQGGDPTGTGTGGPGYTIKGEFNLNGYKNDLSHTKGVISMARAKDFNSAGSQFFIVLDDSAKTSLDNMYASFGKVTEGMEVLEKIESEEFEYTDAAMGVLKNPLKITKATVDTKDCKFKVKKIG